MKNKSNKIKIAGFLTVAIVCFGFNFGESVTAQNSGRQRVVTKPTPKPTPEITPTPTPISTPTATPTPVPIQTLADLQSRIRTSLARPELRRGQIGVKIVSLDTGKMIFEENGEKYFMPASNMKSLPSRRQWKNFRPNFALLLQFLRPQCLTQTARFAAI